MAWRFKITAGLVALAYIALGAYLYSLQVGNIDLVHPPARAAAEKQQVRVLSDRGVIYLRDRDGIPVPAATNRTFSVIYAVPKEIEDPLETSYRLAAKLPLSQEEIFQKLSKKDDPYELLAKKVSEETVREIAQMHIRGIYTGKDLERFYPLGELTAHVIGFVGPRDDQPGVQGKYGIERYYDEALQAEVAPGRQGLGDTDLSLTIDVSIQQEAEEILRNLVTKYQAEGGLAIVEDVATGAILAMVSVPSYDPNKYSRYPLGLFLNPAVEKIYEPGSVMKVITMAAGIDSGAVTPSTTYIDKGYLVIDGSRIQNYDFLTKGPHGKTTMTNVIEHSINTGSVFVQQKMGRDIFLSYLKKFGFDEKTGIDLPGELKGNLRQLHPHAKDIAYATASYGQGIAVTPIELISAFSAIANDGVLMRPYLNAALQPKVVRRVVRPETAKQVREMMVSAVDKAKVATIPGYSVGGKTGTAYVPDFEHGGYTHEVINTYIGFAPASKPRFTVLIRLDKPEGAPYAALTVVPAFRELMQFLLNYSQVPADRVE
ncbi:penicillin-binding protein 2 [Candidatus Parcubacteria bacterium]|nr:MAG: penicillin-binding protein 2 [Candidatus Parcubacteria bacterium]